MNALLHLLTPATPPMVQLDPAPSVASAPSARALPTPSVQVRSAAARELDVKLVPWNVVINTNVGLESFSRGAFALADAGSVYLYPPEHGGVDIGLDQSGRPKPVRTPIGRATKLWEDASAAYATFKVAPTAQGDEMMGRAAAGILTGASIEFAEIPGGTSVARVNGRVSRTHTRVKLLGACLTHRPAYSSAGVVSVR